MKRDKIVKWLAILTLVLGIGAIAGGGLVSATNATSDADPKASQEGVSEPVVGLAADDRDAGLLIARVVPDGPAATAGLVRGDILLELDGEPVNSLRELQRQLADLDVGAQVELKVLHGDDERTLTATLDEQNGRPYLGVIPCGGLPIAEWETVFPESYGVVITRVLPDTPAAAAGLQEGDRILTVGGQELDSESDLAELVTAYEPGDTVTLEIERPGEEPLEVSVELGEHPEQAGVAYLGVEYLPLPRLGHVEGRFGPFEMPRFELPPLGDEEQDLAGQGALIRSVSEDSPAATAGLSEGDVITAIDGQPVDSPQDLVEAIAERAPGDTVALTVFASEEEEAREVEITLAENPAQEGQAYLGVAIGGFLRWRHSEGERPPLGQLPFDLPVPPLDGMPFFNLPHGERIQGVIIRSVAEDSPADDAELSKGDVITSIDGEPVESPQGLLDAIAEHEPGDVVTLIVLVPGEEEERELEITLAEHPENEGQAYLGVFIGGFLRMDRSEEREGLPGMRPLEEFLEQFRDRFPFHHDNGDRLEWLPRPHRDGFDFDLPDELFDWEPCCTEDVTA
jgi:S1-C subfamily serine protease